VTGAKHAMPKARHAADRQARTAGASGLSLALSATRQRASRVIRPAPVPELGGAVVDTKTSAWQVMMRTAQTPAFGVVVIAGLVFAGFDAATPPLLTHSLTPHPAHSSAPHPAHTPTPLGPAPTGAEPRGGIYLAPPLAETKVENPRGLGPDSTAKIHDEATNDSPGPYVPKADADPDAPKANADLDAALNELDRQADRDEAWASQHPAPPPAPACSPICTGSTAPTPHQGPVQAGGASGR
jgi:hypothetical protein